MAESESTLSIQSDDEGKKGIFSRIIEWKPAPRVEFFVVSLTVPILLWLAAFLLFHENGLPGGQIFALVVVLVGGIALGSVIELVRFPPLLGMLAVGMIIRNVEGIKFGTDLKSEVSGPLRQIALVVILIRAGLGLDPAALKRLSTVVIRLAFSPCLVEATVMAIASHFILDFPWAWGFLLGFVLAAVSPAVIVPCLLNLRDRGFGLAKGIPTIVIAAASVDDILAISAFGVAIGFAISQKESLTMTILQGPIEVVLGVLFGLVWGGGLGVFITSSEQENKDVTVYRVLLTFGGGILAVFGFQYLEYSGSGALGCLLAAFVAAVIWREKGVLDDNDNLNWTFQKLWFLFQPLLFGLIGSEIDFQTLDSDAVMKGLLCLAIALTCRIIISFLVVAGAGLTIKERAFIAIAWLPKATVQAAIGSVALDMARKDNLGVEAEKRGLEVLTIAVLSILITAPVGAIAIMIFGPKFLSQDSPDDRKTLSPKSKSNSTDKILDGEEVEEPLTTAKTGSVTHQIGQGDPAPILSETKEVGSVGPTITLETQDIRIQMVSITSSPKSSRKSDGR